MNFKLSKLLLFFALLVNAGIVDAQIPNKESIKNIRNIFQQINSQKNLEQFKVENEELTDEVPDGGVSLIGFFKDKRLQKVEQWAGLSHGTIQIEYYFNKDSLIFVYVTEKHFRRSGDTLNHSKIDLKFEGRYYFKDDILIYKATKGHGFWNDSNDSVQSLLPDSKHYLKFLYSKKNNDG